MMNSVENNKGRTGVIRFVASMALSGKLLLLVIGALIPRIIVFLQPQIITINGTLYFLKKGQQILLPTPQRERSFFS
jgi:uncharacterized membrane protein (Fun14 family)